MPQRSIPEHPAARPKTRRHVSEPLPSWGCTALPRKLELLSVELPVLCGVVALVPEVLLGDAVLVPQLGSLAEVQILMLLSSVVLVAQLVPLLDAIT